MCARNIVDVLLNVHCGGPCEPPIRSLSPSLTFCSPRLPKKLRTQPPRSRKRPAVGLIETGVNEVIFS